MNFGNQPTKTGRVKSYHNEEERCGNDKSRFRGEETLEILVGFDRGPIRCVLLLRGRQFVSGFGASAPERGNVGWRFGIRREVGSFGVRHDVRH